MMIRRRFLQTIAAASSFGLAKSLAQTEKPTLDIHVHLFGVGDNQSGCKLAPVITSGFQFIVLKSELRLNTKGKTLDEAFVNVLVEQTKASGLTKVALLGQDAVYDSSGKPDWKTTSFYIPNDYIFKVTAEHKEHFIPCPNINPQRADAMDELNRIHAKGAKLFKIHPPTQGVDVSAKKHTKFFQRCAELKMIVLVHTGHEHSAPVIDKDLANPKRLELALDQGATIVACHAGTGWATDTPDQLPAFLGLLKLYPKLYGDTSVLGTAGRTRDFYRLLENPLAKSRLLHGSDFPFPTSPNAFKDKLGEEPARKIHGDNNWIRRDYELKKALGIGQESAERSWQLVFGS